MVAASTGRDASTSGAGPASFFAQLAAHPLLSADEEVALARAVEAGRAAQERRQHGRSEPGDAAATARGQAAFDRFVLSNLRLVAKLAGEAARRSGVDLEDLIQEGCIGLVRAVEGYDWRRGTRFSTYATWWIRKALQQGLQRGERSIRLPAAVHDALARVHAATSRLEAELGATPDVGMLADATNLSAAAVRAALEADRRTVSLDQPTRTEAASPLADLVAVASDDPAAEALDRVLAGEIVAHARRSLDPRARYVLLHRFGLLDGRPWTLDEIANELGVSRETARLDLNRALARLRATTVDVPGPAAPGRTLSG